jgi:hypothetical protein
MNQKTPPRLPIVRPGAEPTHDDPAGGKRWHYLDLNGQKMDPHAFAYEHVSGGYGGECLHSIFPDGYSPDGPATMDHIRGRIEGALTANGFEVIDPPEWWTEAQMVRSVLPEGFGLSGPGVCGDRWRVVKGGKETGRGHLTPSAALHGALKVWVNESVEAGRKLDEIRSQYLTAEHSTIRKANQLGAHRDLIQAVEFQHAISTVTVTLPDSTKIEVCR